jgi:hypothetical protein
MPWLQHPVSPTPGSLPLIAVSWAGILLARQPAIIDRNRWMFSLKQEFIQAVEGSWRRVNRLPTGHLFRLNSAWRYDSCTDSWSKSALSGSRKIPEKLLFENLLLSAG